MTDTVAQLWDSEAERAVLGAILIDPSVADDVGLVIDASSFGDVPHQEVYRAITNLRDAGKRPDARLVIPELKRMKAWDHESTPSLLAEIANAVPTTANAVYYARQVREWQVRRGLTALAANLGNDALDETQDANEVLERAETAVFGLASQETRGEPVCIGSLLPAIMDLEREQRRGLETGYVDLDAILGGLQPGELTILAARPSVGKSAFALNIAENVAVKRKVSTLIVSLEMTNIELSNRLLCSIGRVDSWRFRKNDLGRDDHDSLVQAAGAMNDAPLRLDDAPMRSASQIASIARRTKRRHGLELLIVDYLQLVVPEDKRAPRQEQVAASSRRFKALARELNIPVLCLAQLNRQVEQTKGRPVLSNLRESGAIEQDADVVMFLHRKPAASDEEMESSGVECIVAKNRNGPIGIADLVWLRAFTRFETADRHQREVRRYSEFDAWQSGSQEEF